MKIPVVCKNGKERTVNQDELQFLMATSQVMFFKRSDGWVVVGRDKMRQLKKIHTGDDRREHGEYAKDYWY